MLAIVQARMSSTRLPGKVLKPLLGEPMLIRQVERARRARSLSQVVVATSTDPSDDPLAAACETYGVACERGSLNDVLDRYYRVAASRPGTTTVVRLTGDCPLCDPAVIDQVADVYAKGGYDYVSNTLAPTFPDGLDVEVCSMAALTEAWQRAELPSEREHVTPYLKKGVRFRTFNVVHGTDLSALRWTVDEPEDFAFVSDVYERLHPRNPEFGMQDVLDLLRIRPQLGDVNRGFERDEGYRKSLLEDGTPSPGDR